MEENVQKDTAAPTSKPIYKRRWFKWMLAIYIVFLIVFTLLPVGIRYAAEYFLKEQGIQHAEIKDVDLNLFTGEFGLSGVNVSGNSQGHVSLTKLYLNIAMLELLNKRAVVQHAEINGLDLDVVNDASGTWVVAGIPLPAPTASEAPEESDEAGEPWGVGVDLLSLANIQVDFSMPQLETDLRLNELQLKQLASWQPDQVASYQLSLRIDDAPLNINGQMYAFKQAPEFNGTLDMDKLPLTMADGFIKETGIEKLQGLLAINTVFDVTLETEQPIVSTDTKIKLSDLDVKQGQYQVQATALSWAGDVDYLAPVDEVDLGARAKGNLSLQKFKLNDAQANMDLAIFEQLDVNDVSLGEGQQTTVSNIVLKQLSLLSNEKNEKLAQLADITTTEIAFDGKQTLEIKDITLSGLDAKFKINPDSTLHLLDTLTDNTEAQEQLPSDASTEANEDVRQISDEDETDSAPFNVKLARLHVAEDSQIVFDDESVKPAYHAEIKPLSLTVSDVDTSAIDQDILVDLKALINKHETLDVNAKLKPFGEKLNMSADAKIKALELPPVSPYLNSAIGYYIKTGQLNADINGEIIDDQIDYKVNVALNKFVVEEGDPAKAKSYSERLSMPLNTSLELLRDKDDNIKLEVPITGDINDPQFDVSQVINKALANATKAAVTGYLAFMLQPWGVALLAADMLRGDGSVGLDPVVFEAAQVEVSGEYSDYLAKISTLLNERDNIQINICAVTSEQDRQALLAMQQATQKPEKGDGKTEQQAVAQSAEVEISNEKLLELAKIRNERVKALLIENGVDPGRLFTCQPVMDGSDKHSPQVMLTL